jgi:hypothetical protein
MYDGRFVDGGGYLLAGVFPKAASAPAGRRGIVYSKVRQLSPT